MSKFTSAQAANEISIAESTLRKSRVTGILCGRPAPQYTKLGRRVIYDSEDLYYWLAQLPKGNCTQDTAA